jgi:Yip1 domain
VNAAAEPSRSLQKEWWLRTLAIFQSPRSVFLALRDDSDEAAEARQEPVLAIVILAGVAGVLTTSLAGELLDDSRYDGWNLAVWAFLGGIFYGTLVYWLGGLLVHALASALGTGSSYRQARHVIGFAAAPLALSLLLVWPVRIALYGGDLFRTGGSDTGTGDRIFDGLIFASYVWTFGLVALGLLELRKRSSSSSDIS